MFCVSYFFLFSFSRLFPLPDALSDVSLTNARFSDRIRSKGGRLYPERLCRPTLQLSVENNTTFVSGQREQATERIDLFNCIYFPYPALVG